MTATRLDHLVVAADTLQKGVEHVEALLGVAMNPGGRHPRMGTHNALLRLGEAVYLEVIAIDPAAEPPDRPRWFGLDQPLVRGLLKQRPRLLHWVVNTVDIEATRSRCPVPPGAIESMSRGELRWRITIPEDSSLPAGGLLPSLIQWQTTTHPASRMPDSGCTLRELTIHSPNSAWLESMLRPIGAESLVELRPLEADALPCLHARIETPDGLKTL